MSVRKEVFQHNLSNHRRVEIARRAILLYLLASTDGKPPWISLAHQLIFIMQWLRTAPTIQYDDQVARGLNCHWCHTNNPGKIG